MSRNYKCLVLSGGNTKGAYQAGALLVIEAGYGKPECAIGTSIGAINSCLYNYLNSEELYSLWLGVNNRKDFLSLNWKPLLKGQIPGGLYAMDKTKSLISEKTKGREKTLRSIASVVHMGSGTLNYFDDNHPKYLDMVIASGSEPLGMQNIGPYLDGGVREQVPIKKALDLGYKPSEIICVVNNPLRKDPAEGEYGGIHKNVYRAVDIMIHDVFWNDISDYLDSGITFVAPEAYLYSSFNFDNADIRRALTKGAEDARKALY